MPFPDFRALRNIPVSKEDIVEAFNRETSPLLRQIREWLLSIRGTTVGYVWTLVDDGEGGVSPSWQEAATGSETFLSAGQLALVSSYESNWQSNSMAALALSGDDTAMEVLLFDDGQSDGGGFTVSIPANTPEMTLTASVRAVTTSAETTLTAYARALGGAWSDVGSVATTPLTTWSEAEIELDLTGLDGQAVQFELVRTGGTLGGMELAGVGLR